MRGLLKIPLTLGGLLLCLKAPFNYFLLLANLDGSSILLHLTILDYHFYFLPLVAYVCILFSNALLSSIWRYITCDINCRQKAVLPDAFVHVLPGLSAYYISLYIQEIRNETYKYSDAFFHDH